MKIKIPKLFFKNDEKVDFNPKMIDWNDPTVCVLCRKIDCICTVQLCECGKKADNCVWSNDYCPCPKCLEINKDCKCIVEIKKEK